MENDMRHRASVDADGGEGNYTKAERWDVRGRASSRMYSKDNWDGGFSFGAKAGRVVSTRVRLVLPWKLVSWSGGY